MKQIINAEISNQLGTFSKNVEFSVLPKIINHIPVTKLDIWNLSIRNYIELTENNFYVPDQIDELITSELLIFLIF